ncbi:MAG: hypothetical protein QOH58_845 [Thermoleophilaceae bacterium]|nr:hypothetical protein [Thermoleophilaceae bacterium]
MRRIDASLFAAEDDIQAPGLAGSWAVGCAWSTKPPAIGEVEVGRSVVVGGGLVPDPLVVQAGAHSMLFEPSSVAGKGPLDPLRGLQNAMRDAEARMAKAALHSGSAELVVADGPLGYSMPGCLVGMAKRQSRAYLDALRARVLSQLRAGERSPIFKLGDQRLQRYSWYLRLADGRAIDGTMAGVVRLEVDASPGLAAAQDLAELAGGVLPAFASRPGHDPRAPQNLYPVGALESHLRHRLGDALLVRRAIEVRLLEEVSVA